MNNLANSTSHVQAHLNGNGKPNGKPNGVRRVVTTRWATVPKKTFAAKASGLAPSQLAAIAALLVLASRGGKKSTLAQASHLLKVSVSSVAAALRCCRSNKQELVAVANGTRPIELGRDRLKHEIRMAGVESALDLLAEVDGGAEVIL